MKTIYVLARQLETHRQAVQELAQTQVEAKKAKSKVNSVAELSTMQSAISQRQNMIRQHHEAIDEIKEQLRQYPRGEEGLKISAQQLSERLTDIKEMYSVETTGQRTRKKNLTDGSVFASQDEFSLAQSQKMKAKLQIQDIVAERKLIKAEYKIVTDKLYHNYKLAYAA